MLYIGDLPFLDGQTIKKSVSGVSIFELPRLENCIRCVSGGPHTSESELNWGMGPSTPVSPDGLGPAPGGY